MSIQSIIEQTGVKLPNSISWCIKWESKEQRDEYVNWRQNSSWHIKQIFNSKELAIFYMHYALGWGHRKVFYASGFTRATFRKVIKKFKDYARNADVMCQNEITISEAYSQEILVNPLKNPQDD